MSKSLDHDHEAGHGETERDRRTLHALEKIRNPEPYLTLYIYKQQEGHLAKLQLDDLVLGPESSCRIKLWKGEV